MSSGGEERDKNTKSRLDPEPIARRDFLGRAALWTCGSAVGVAVLGMLRLPKAAVLPSPSKRFKVELPENLQPGQAFIPPGRQVAIFKDSGGKVYAISIVCTHLGCLVKPTPRGFDCPCHGSKFRADGSVARGPAPTPLKWHAVKKIGDGVYIIDEGKVVPPRTTVKA